MAQVLHDSLRKKGVGGFDKSEENLMKQLYIDNLPKHIALIMDGNGRWAQKRKMPRNVGHKYGAEALKKIVMFCNEINIQILSVYAFSTENWRRPKTEVDMLMKLLIEYLQREIDLLNRNNIRLEVSGDMEYLPVEVRSAVQKGKEVSKFNTGLILNVALNYGGRDEIARAARQIAEKVKNGEYNIQEIDKTLMEKHLYTSSLGDPELLIRTSGERRLSNFLLWQLAYTELFFTDILWPDFDRIHLLEALCSYQKRERRFGGI
ncbi:MAG: isoprenyl transferase [Clostridia bacterium]|nr:isoprenyl transferase [Clostridia bacterium]